jgi:DNA segregation ATPase FtsK/SpoIIIE, S-DNA-T family
MPSALANGLRDTLARIWGALLLAAVACGWASLLFWSISDPSLSHATSAPARNLLGTFGASLSDLLLQTFGLASFIILLAPMVWGIALLSRDRIGSTRTKLVAWIAAIATTAAAGSALPRPAGWPLHYGLGGIIGDVLMRLATGVATLANAEYAGLMAGLAFACAAVFFISVSIGVGRKDLAAAVADTSWPTARSRKSRTRPATGRQQSTPLTPGLSMEPPFTVHETAQRTPSLNPGPAAFESAADDTSHARTAQSWPAHPATEPHPAAKFGPYAAYDPEPPLEQAFDDWTEAASSGIAARFAPSQVVGNIAQQAAGARGLQQSLAATYPSPADPVLPDDTPRYATAMTLAEPAKPQPYKRPSLNLLERPVFAKTNGGFTHAMLRGNARLLEDTLADFGVNGEIREIKPGPVITLYEFEPARGTKIARVVSLADDIARAMGASAVRIAVMPGRTAIGIELPNPARDTVYLRDIFDAEAYRGTMDRLPVALGRTISGEPVVADLARMPHMLIAGTTGSGKSVGINAMILSLIYKHGPDDCRFLMIDPKMLELSVYNGIPHLLTPVVTDPHKAITALAWCVTEMEERYKRMASLGVRNIDVFNNRVRNAKKLGQRLARTVQTGFDRATGEATFEKEEMSLEPMPYIVIVVDEFADLMAVAGKEIEGSVQRLAQAARAAGIHLIMATQRPSVDIVTGAIKANIPARASYKVASPVDSRTILNTEGAEQLLGAGDMLYAAGNGPPVRLHGPFVSDEEVESVASHLRAQGAPRYIDGLMDGPVAPQARSSIQAPTPAVSHDALYDRAVAIIVRDRRASRTHLERRLRIEPEVANAVLQRLQADGLIGPVGTDGHHPLLNGQGAAA